MTVSYKIYKNSILATILDIAGSICVAIGACLAVTALFDGRYPELIVSLFVVAIGIGIKFLSSFINHRATSKKLKKAISDPKLISKIKESSVAAYSLYKNQPSELTYGLVKSNNPFAITKIDEMKSGTLSEEDAIEIMRQHDSIGTDGKALSTSDISYSNKFFKITNL